MQNVQVGEGYGVVFLKSGKHDRLRSEWPFFEQILSIQLLLREAKVQVSS